MIRLYFRNGKHYQKKYIFCLMVIQAISYILCTTDYWSTIPANTIILFLRITGECRCDERLFVFIACNHSLHWHSD